MATVTVSRLVKYLKNRLEIDDNLASLKVTGEISNYHRHFSSGHLYFTLKDANAQISCVMFKSSANSLKFEPKNGDKVELSARVSIFEASGQLQLYVTSIRLQGLGDLYQRYEELKTKLANEGYFNDSHKKEIPCAHPEKIAVLVGDKSAAMSDIKICFKRRWPLCSVDYYPVLVQGVDAPKNIISVLKEVDKKEYEIIILARGGGSFEDLFCFNDEELVKTIYSLKTFIVSGIGHEQDFTLTDFVSDLRAATPTACVELVTPNIEDVNDEVDSIEKQLTINIYRNINILNENLNKLSSNKYFLNPHLITEKSCLKLDNYLTRIVNYSNKLKQIENRIDVNLEKIKSSIIHDISIKRTSIENFENLLKLYSIDNTLKRGFSLVYKNDKLISNIDDLSINDNLNIKLYKGKLKAKVGELNGKDC